MSLLAPQRGAAGQARNPVRSYEELSMPSGGLSITTAAGANAISAYSTITSPANDLSGLLFMIQNGSTNTSRCQLYVKVNGTVVVSGLYVKLNTSDQTHIYVPVKVPASATVEVAFRFSANGHTRVLSIHGEVANATDAPGYSLIKNLTLDTANTYAGNVNVPGTDTWTQLIASVDANYDAFMVNMSAAGTAPTTGQIVMASLGVGASPAPGSEFWRWQQRVSASEPYAPGGLSPIIYMPLTAGNLISAKITCPTSDSVNFRPGLIGLQN